MSMSQPHHAQRPYGRRGAIELEPDACREILDHADYGVMAAASLDASPYAVPLGFVRIDDALYIHGSGLGHRNEVIGQNPRVCFCVVGSTTVHPDLLDRDYESVLVFGRARVIVGEEKRRAMDAYVAKYCPDQVEEGARRLNKSLDRIFVVRIKIEHMTGKAHRAGEIDEDE